MREAFSGGYMKKILSLICVLVLFLGSVQGRALDALSHYTIHNPHVKRWAPPVLAALGTGGVALVLRKLKKKRANLKKQLAKVVRSSDHKSQRALRLKIRRCERWITVCNALLVIGGAATIGLGARALYMGSTEAWPIRILEWQINDRSEGFRIGEGAVKTLGKLSLGGQSEGSEQALKLLISASCGNRSKWSANRELMMLAGKNVAGALKTLDDQLNDPFDFLSMAWISCTPSDLKAVALNDQASDSLRSVALEGLSQMERERKSGVLRIALDAPRNSKLQFIALRVASWEIKLLRQTTLTEGDKQWLHDIVFDSQRSACERVYADEVLEKETPRDLRGRGLRARFYDDIFKRLCLEKRAIDGQLNVLPHESDRFNALQGESKLLDRAFGVVLSKLGRCRLLSERSFLEPSDMGDVFRCALSKEFQSKHKEELVDFLKKIVVYHNNHSVGCAVEILPIKDAEAALKERLGLYQEGIEIQEGGMELAVAGLMPDSLIKGSDSEKKAMVGGFLVCMVKKAPHFSVKEKALSVLHREWGQTESPERREALRGAFMRLLPDLTALRDGAEEGSSLRDLATRSISIGQQSLVEALSNRQNLAQQPST